MFASRQGEYCSSCPVLSSVGQIHALVLFIMISCLRTSMKPEGEVTNSCTANTGCKHTRSHSPPNKTKPKIKNWWCSMWSCSCLLPFVCHLYVWKAAAFRFSFGWWSALSACPDWTDCACTQVLDAPILRRVSTCFDDFKLFVALWAIWDTSFVVCFKGNASLLEDSYSIAVFVNP